MAEQPDPLAPQFLNFAYQNGTKAIWAISILRSFYELEL